MPESYRPTSENRLPKRSFPVNMRVLAVLVMVIGVMGFFGARIFLGDQPFVYFLSTLVTFAGLGMVILARRTAGPVVNDTPPVRISRRNIPPGLRPRRGAASTRQTELPGSSRPKMTSHPNPQNDIGQTIPEILSPIPLLEQAVLTFASQGAQVERSSQRAGRGILTITTPEGRQGVALVLADAQDVTLADVRGLVAMAQHSQSAFGYLIAEGRIPSDAIDWAAAQSSALILHLVPHHQVADIRL